MERATAFGATDLSSNCNNPCISQCSEAPVVRCKTCDFLICTSHDLCFYVQNPASIHLTIKIEHMKPLKNSFNMVADNDRNKFIASTVYCKGCGDPIGNESLIGPKRIGVLCFSSSKVVFHFADTGNTELFTRKDWAAFQQRYSRWIECRTFESFYPVSHTVTNKLGENDEAMNVSRIESFPLVYPTVEIMQHINPNSLTKSNPRSYQIELLLTASLGNTIVHLPTGCGKTLVSAMFISLMKQLNPKRLCIFLVTKVPLAYQQCNYLTQETCLKCVVLCGESKQEIYFTDLYSYDVIVFTAQVFLNYLTQGRISLARISCIVLDEIHHATGTAPFALFFDQHYDQFPDHEKPVIMGLTASPFEINLDPQKSMDRLNELCTLVWSDLCSPIIYHKDMLEHCSDPNASYCLIKMDETEGFFECKLENYIQRIFKNYQGIFGIAANSPSQEWSNAANIRNFISSVEERAGLSDEQLSIIHHIKQVWHATEALQVIGFIEAYECLQETLKMMQQNLDNPWSIEDVKILIDLCNQFKVTSKDYSNRFKALIEILTGDSVEMGSKMLVFVKARKTARWLTKRLRENKLINAQWNPECIVGQGGGTIDGMTWKEQQRPIIANFHKGTTRLLVATNVIQEGIDVPSCDCVIHFDIVDNVTQLVQSRGRARFKSSDFILICTEAQRDQCLEVFRKEAKTKRLVEAYMLENFKRQDRPEFCLYMSCLAHMLYNARHLRAEKKTAVPFKMVHKSKYSRSIVIQILNITEAQLPQIMSFIESGLVYRYVSEPVDDVLFYDRKSIDVDCLIPDVDNKSICHVFLKIFESLRETHPDFKYCMRRKISTFSLDLDVFTLECFGIDFGSLVQPHSFATFHQLNQEICLLISFQSKMIRIFFAGTKLFMIEIPFIALDSFVQISINDGIINFVIPTVRSPHFLECDIPSNLANGRLPNMQEFVENYVGFRWKRTSHFSCLPSQIIEKSFCFNLNMFMNEATKLQSIYALSMFEKIGVAVYFTPCMTTTPSNNQDINACLCEITKKFGFDVSFMVACFFTTCAPYISGQLNDTLFNGMLQSLDKNFLLFLSKELLRLYSLPSNRFMSVDKIIQRAIQNYSQSSIPDSNGSAPLNSCHVKFVTITPTRIIFNETKLMNSNRLLRHFGPENFVRVQFREESLQKLSAGQSLYPMDLVFERLALLIKEGIQICGIPFELLAMSSSQLRNHGCWFYNASLPQKPDYLRAWLGDFSHIKNVAKYVARLGQSLSASVEYCDASASGSIDFGEIPDVVRRVPSVQNPSTEIEYNFTDGIGCISPQLMQTVCSNFGLAHIPSAIQIRIGGYKGVVAVYPRIGELGSFPMLLRPSMRKFSSRHKKLDILNFSEYIPCYLNRQVIMIMSALGVPDEAFEALQNDMLLRMINTLVYDCELLLYLNSSYKCPYFTSNELLFDRTHSCINYTSEPFFRSLAICSYEAQLNDLLNKSRIYLPKGRILMGVVDESGLLAPDQVFIQCSVDSRDAFENYATFSVSKAADKTKFIVTGDVCIAKNPCMHPGDLRVVRAVHNDFLASFMWDVVVFPKTGSVPIPTMCSGSDLDGDLYFVTWDSSLIPPAPDEPLPYMELAQQATVHDCTITMHHVADFMINFIKNDQLGIIANTHVAHSDQRELGVRDPLCKTLAGLFSMAVDFPKTGFVATLPDDAKVTCYPDFMQKPHLPTYESSKIIGKLFRKVRDIAKASKRMKSQRIPIDEQYLVDGFDEYLDSASKSFFIYESHLKDIMRRYGIKNECEIFTNSLLQNDMVGNEDKKDVMKLVSILVQELRLKTRNSFFTEEIKQHSAEALKKASAWYYIAYSQAGESGILSFPWLVEDLLMTIQRTNRFQFSDILSANILKAFHAYNSKYSVAHQLLERIELFKRIESVTVKVDSKLHCKLFGSTVTLMFDLLSDLNILIEHFIPERHQEQLVQRLRKEFSDQIQVFSNESELVIKGHGSTFEFCISFHSYGSYDDTIEILSFFNEFPSAIPLLHFLIRACRYMGILKKISCTVLCIVFIRCIYYSHPELQHPSYCLFTASFLTHLLATAENNQTDCKLQEWNFAAILFKLLAFLSDERKVTQHIPTLDPSLCSLFFTIHNLCIQSMDADSILDCLRTSYDRDTSNEISGAPNLAAIRKLKFATKGYKSGLFVAGSSKLLFESSQAGGDLVHFEIYQSRKRPSHMDMNCYAPHLSYGVSNDFGGDYVKYGRDNANPFVLDDKNVFAEFYQLSFRQFTFLRDNYSAEKFGTQVTARIKLGSVYITSIPKMFVQETLSCTVENVQLALSKGYRSIDLDFEDIFSKSQAFLDSFNNDGKGEAVDARCSESVAATSDIKKDLESLREIIDKNGQKSFEKDPRTEFEEKEIKRKRSKRQGPMNSSFESYVYSHLPMIMFLEKYRFRLEECIKDTLACFVIIPARSNPKTTVHLIITYDSTMKFLEANYAPLKWIQLDVVACKSGGHSQCESSESVSQCSQLQTDFRFNLTTLKKLDLDSLKRMIPDEHFTAIAEGKIISVNTNKELHMNSLLNIHPENCFCRKSTIRRYAPTAESQQLLQQTFPQLIRYFSSEIWLKLHVKLSTMVEYSFPDPKSGRFTLATEKCEVESRIRLEPVDLKNSLYYDELIHILWAMGKFYSRVANE